MKGIIILMLIASSAKGQFSIGMGLGVSKSAPIIDAVVGMDGGFAFLKGGFIAPISNKVANPVMINIQGGHTFWINDFFVKPAAGYSINYRSSDRKDLNTKSAIFSFEVGKRLEGRNDVGILFGYCEKVWMAEFKMRVNIF